MLDLTRVEAPDDEPISVDEAKAHMGVLHAHDDDLIGSYIAAVVDYLDGYSGVLGRAIVAQTWALRLDRLPVSGCILLPLQILQEVVSITYRNAEGETRTVEEDTYTIRSGVNAIRRAPGRSWPSDIAGEPGAVTVTFVAGYGAPSAVPFNLKQAIKIMVADLYANRETPMGQNAAANALLAPCRSWRV